MNQNTSKNPFLPRDKPKSWILFVISALAGLLIAGPLFFSGIMLEMEALQFLGGLLFWCFWIAGALMWFVFISRSIAGHYKGIGDRDWSEQIW